MEKVKVAIRVRPMNKREIELGTQNVINVETNQIIITNLANSKEGRKSSKTFAYDYCFDSSFADRPNYATQEIVYNCIGLDIINNAFNGYNSCIFAYGQTGSGKSYTMTGSIDNKGLIPRICEGLFDDIKNKTNENDKNLVKIEVSYMEIYNEKVLDLLDPRGLKNNLKVREHKLLGPYVDGLSQLAVSSYKDIEVLINEGNKSRTVAATNMNSESSRSHAVFCLKISQTIIDTQTGISGEKVSKLSLVDLAGSEKASKTGVEGDRLKEGCNINRSLLTLGIVISALADNTSSSNSNKAKHIPYRDSVLTWLLKDSLGGNSKTVMIATISPAFDNYEETMSTLKYADRAKRIVNHAIVNEDPNAKLVRELREEIELLKKQLKGQAKTVSTNELVETLNETENIYKELSKPWDEKLAETQNIQREWSQTLEKLGISVQSSGIKVEKDKFYLVNMSADPSMNELLVYYLKESTVVGRINSKSQLDIQLSGPGIAEEHCVFEIRENEVYVKPLNVNAKTRVNGTLINDETLLHHSDRVVLGVNHYFRINCPNKNKHHERLNSSYSNNPDNIDNDDFNDMNGDYEDDDDDIDYAEAQKEILMNDDNTYFQNAFDLKNKKFDDNNLNNVEETKEQKMFKVALSKLQEQLIRANTLVREANVLSKEMDKKTIFSVTLQISPTNLKLNRNKDILQFEPAVSVKRSDKNLHQVWSLEKFENRIVDMREMYREIQNRNQTGNVNSSSYEDENDPFYEALENHKLIGVANLFLDALFCDCKFDYSIPIINQQGDIAGYLKVQLTKDKHYINELDDMTSSNNSQADTNSENSDDLDKAQVQKKTIKCLLTIKEAIGLPFSLSNFVFCQYKFWNETDARCVAPEADDEAFKLNKLSLSNKYSFLSGISIKFNRSEEHIVKITEDFVDYCTDASLPIEVWGHHNITDDPQQHQQETFENSFLFKYANLIESWQQVRKSFKLWVDILEIDKNGQWAPVHVRTHKKNHTGGIYQLKQGQSKRIKIRIEEKSIYRDLLPLYVDDISSIEVGCVQLFSTQLNDKLILDSYQEEDLTNIRKKWLHHLDQRKSYYEAQFKLLIDKQDKSSIDTEREKYLYDQLVELAEERNLVETPPENSHLPGSTLTWKPDPGMEENIPIIFLENDEATHNDSISYSSDGDNATNRQIYGNNCLLANEEPDNEYFILPVINKQLETSNNNNIEAIAIWDSTIHEDNALNLVTQNDNYVSLIVKIKLKLVQPIETEVYIRKRICVQIYDPNANSNNNANLIINNVKSNFSKFFKNLTTNITGSQLSLLNPNQKDTLKNEVKLTSTGVTYYIISNIPRCLEDYEQYDNLAIMAAINNPSSSTNTSANLIEKYLEKYMKCINAVDSLLKNDKKQQELALQQAIRSELNQKQSLDSSSKTSISRLSNSNLSSNNTNLKKTNSVPNLLNSKSLKFGSTQNINKLSKPAVSSATNNFKVLSSTPEQPTQQQQNKQYTPIIGNQQEPIIKNGANRFNKNPALKQNNLTKKLDKLVKPQLNSSLLTNSNQTNESISNGTSVNLNITAPAALITETNSITETIVEPASSENKRENVDGTIIDASTKKIIENENIINENHTFVEEIKPPVIKIDKIDEDEGRMPTTLSETKIDSNKLSEQMAASKTQITHATSETSLSNENEREKLPEWIKENAHVIVSTNTVLNQPGIIRFIGEVKFAKGLWIGVELERERGLNDGSIKGHRYFQCPPEKGVFVKPDKLTLNRNYQ